MLDPRICYRALQTRDERFDGRFVVGVTSTGIYCRPICPANAAKLEHCRFFPTAAAAQEAGFRPCLRCRPETAPAGGVWRGTSSTVSRGLAMIADGELDGEAATVDALAQRLGVGERQLRRLFQRHLGASPVAVAQTRRVHFAKQLLHDTRLPMAEVAFAAGFGSVRRFNETFRKLYHRPPSALRGKRAVALPEGTVGDQGVTLRLGYRPPYDWEALLAHLRARAVDGVERVDPASYCRTVVDESGRSGTVEITHRPAARCLEATIRFPSVRALPGLVARIRRSFDLDADVTAIGSHLARDPMLAAMVAARPGLRAPGAWDGFEAAVRAVLGQGVSLEAGRRLVVQLVRSCGSSVPLRGLTRLDRAFPSASQVAAADLSALHVPGARRRALAALASAALSDPLLFQPLHPLHHTVARLRAIPGMGYWTAHYIALRAAREPDAFPEGDAALLLCIARLEGVRVTRLEIRRHAEAWRPWRAYAAEHFWAADASQAHPHGGPS